MKLNQAIEILESLPLEKNITTEIEEAVCVLLEKVKKQGKPTPEDYSGLTASALNDLMNRPVTPIPTPINPAYLNAMLEPWPLAVDLDHD